MKKNSATFYLIIAGAAIFNWVFWQEKPGINMVIFALFICSCIILLYPYSLKNRICVWILIAHIFSSAMVIVTNTLVSEISFVVTLLLFMSFSQYIHRSALYAGGSVLINYLLAIPNLFSQVKLERNLEKNSGKRSLRLLLIPTLIFTIFILVYSSGNSKFHDYVQSFYSSVIEWLEHIFDWFSLLRILFFLSGTFIVTGLLLRSKDYFSKLDLLQNNDLLRKKYHFKKWLESPLSDIMHIIIGKRVKGMLSLKIEYIMGTASLALLNLLLLLINAIDVKYIWMNYSLKGSAQASEYVHEGAGMLILSILMAMILLLVFFRANINFYKQNKLLKNLAYLWILQNLFLVLSVFNRDYYYISHFGLAYKRIGLLFFLIMVLSGLITTGIKIHFRKTPYYLLRVNAWVALTLLIFASPISWDKIIAQYNISKSNQTVLDIPFLLSLSDEALPVIQQHLDLLQTPEAFNLRFNYDGDTLTATQYFEKRKENFLNDQHHYTWLSWNISDNNIRNQLFRTGPSSSLK